MPRSRSARVASSRSIALIGPATPPPPTLSKDDINALPIQAYEGDIRLIRDEEALTDALKHLEREDVLGFDTETRPIFTKGKTSSPALLQLAARDYAVVGRAVKNDVLYGDIVARDKYQIGAGREAVAGADGETAAVKGDVVFVNGYLGGDGDAIAQRKGRAIFESAEGVSKVTIANAVNGGHAAFG